MAWRKNNARACGEDAESCISGIQKAKDAWNTLAEKFKPPEILETQDFNSEVDSGSDDGHAGPETDAVEAYDHETYASFFNKVATAMEYGKWEDVKEFMKQHPEAVRAKHGTWGLTVFHKVVRRQDVRGVKELLSFMRKKDWGILDNEGRTALSLVIEDGHTDDAIEIVKCIVEKNKKLLLRVVHPSAKTVPLVYALSLDKPKMARYLYSVTPLEKLKSRDAAELVSTGLRLKHLDISLDLLRRFPNLAIAEDHSGQSPLNELASTLAGLFSDASKLAMRKRLIYRCMPTPTPTPTPITREVSIDVQNEEKDQGNRKHHIGRVTCSFRRLVVNLRRLFGIDDIYEMKLLNVQAIEILKCMCAVLKEDNYKNMQHKVVVKALFQAVERGHAQFIAKIIWDNWFNPINWFLTVTNEHDKTVFQLAAEHRRREIFALITCFDTKERQEIIGRKDKSGNNMLHVLGKLTPVAKIAHIRGAALQMQNELQWFKGVEGLANPKDLNCINSEGRTPREEFTMNHKDLVKEGASSMKETATSSALVAALIITIKLGPREAAELVSTGLRLKYLDMSLDLLRRFPMLAITKDHSGESPLNELASTHAGLFLDASQLGIWKRLIYICTQIPPTPKSNSDVFINIPEKEIITRKNLICQVICFFPRPVVSLRRLSGIDSLYQMKLLHVRTIEILDQMCKAFENINYMQGSKFAEKALFQAVERGHFLFLQKLISLQLDKSWCLAITNEHDKTLFQFAAEHRQGQIFDLIRYSFIATERKEILSRKDKFRNNMLHVEANRLLIFEVQLCKCSTNYNGSRVLLDEMQKVESMASPKDHNCINSDGLTPREVFTINHSDLVKEAALSMKETATSSSALVAALIITIMSAAVVTVPGGINGGTGIPIYLNTDAFRIFIIADVISLCSSATSVMVFLGIHTSRFAEEDFLTSLPTKLIIGFLSLFLSIGSMMVAFASAVFIMLPGKPSIVIPSIVLAGVPIASFLWMQFPFLLEIIISTYGSSFRPMYWRLQRWAWRIYYRRL